MKFHQFLATTIVAVGVSGVLAHEFKAGDLLIGHPWSRETPGGAKVGGAYLTITNTGKTSDRLLSATTPAAASVEIHEMATTNGVMTMRPFVAGLAIGPGHTVSLAPGGYHLMLLNLKAPLKQGDRLPLTLMFEKTGKVEVMINVEGIGAQHPPKSSDPAMHNMDKM